MQREENCFPTRGMMQEDIPHRRWRTSSGHPTEMKAQDHKPAFEAEASMQAIVDRLEGGIAVLEIDGTRFEDAPLSQLPAGTRQGSVLSGEPGNWHLDTQAQKERLEHNANLMKKLFRD